MENTEPIKRSSTVKLNPDSIALVNQISIHLTKKNQKVPKMTEVVNEGLKALAEKEGIKLEVVKK